jgi:hypothetical protein
MFCTFRAALRHDWRAYHVSPAGEAQMKLAGSIAALRPQFLRKDLQELAILTCENRVVANG